jgi:DHA2 family multidrug resistance protein
MGVSLTYMLLARSIQVSHEQLGAFITPFNRALQSGAAARMLNPANPHGAALLDRMVNQQAQIIAYVNDFKFMMLTTMPALLLLLLMRRPQRIAARPEEHAVMD